MIRRLVPVALSVSLALGCAGSPKRPPAPERPPAAVAAPDPRAEVPPLGPPPELTVPPQRHFALSNGLRVRLVEYRRLPIVALHLAVDAGGIHDPAAQPGLASFTAAMMTEGTKRRSAIQISDDLGFIGASVGAGASFDSASLSGSALSRHLDALLDIYADVLLHPTFPKADFARVKDQRIVSLVQQRDQPGTIAAKAFAEAYWGKHPYGHWLMGTEASLAAMRREDLARFHARWWKPGRAELVVVGDVSEAELRAKLERALGAWKGAPPPAVTPPPPATTGARTVLLAKAGAPQTFLMLGMPGLPRASPDYAAAGVAYQILGGGMASRLFRNLREDKGYTYGVYARGEERKLGGTSFVVGSVKGDVTGKALEALLEEVRRMREQPASAAELENAKNALVLSLPADFATAGGIAAKLAEEVVFGLPDGYWGRFVGEVQAVTAADVQRAAARYLDPAKLTAVMVGEPPSVRPQLVGLPLGSVELRAAPASVRATRAKGTGAKPAKPTRPSHLLPRKPEPRAEAR